MEGMPNVGKEHASEFKFYLDSRLHAWLCSLSFHICKNGDKTTANIRLNHMKLPTSGHSWPAEMANSCGSALNI